MRRPKSSHRNCFNASRTTIVSQRDACKVVQRIANVHDSLVKHLFFSQCLTGNSAMNVLIVWCGTNFDAIKRVYPTTCRVHRSRSHFQSSYGKA